MTNRRMDAIYFLVFPVVLLIGYLVAQFDDEGEETARVDIPDFSFPSIELEAPFELPFSFVEFRRPRAPALVLEENTESVRRELRSALLESSSLVEVDTSVESGPTVEAASDAEIARIRRDESQWAAVSDPRD